MTSATEVRDVRYFTESLMQELGHRLVDMGQITGEQLNDMNARKALTGETLDVLLVRESLVEQDLLLQVLAELSHIPFLRMADVQIQNQAVKTVAPKVALRYQTMPVALEPGLITLAASYVPEQTTVDSLRMLLDMAVRLRLATSLDISRSLTHFYGLGADTINEIVDELDEDEASEVVSATDISVANQADAGMLRFVNLLISEAIKMDATDIHLEPFEETLRLRYRVDGLLQNIPLPKGVERLRRAVPSAIKIMADMDISERRKPHDGRIKVKCRGEEFDLRVSVLPTCYGETVNMRILNRESSFVNLENLGLSASQLPKINKLMELPHGVILLTGPTGSGKTTTLYALLAMINSAGIKIITVEDPIEYQMFGISQIQTHAKIGLTFASILRSILRHDPDVILIGEIRDGETADIAVRASLTGHLVFSTLHTNDAPSAVTRLADMGTEPYLISSCLEGAIAQRLVRRVCRACREPYEPNDLVAEEIENLYPGKMAGAELVHGRGCPACNFTGYKGRSAIIEVMVLDETLRNLIVHQKPSNEIKHAARRNGMVTLREDGWLKTLAGVTSVDEVLRVARKAESPTPESTPFSKLQEEKNAP